MKQLIIRADDLGFTKAVNHGILDTVKTGIVKSVGLMTNINDSLHGVKLVQNYDVCIGLHVNISTGFPLTDPKLIPSLVTETGEFKSSALYRNATEDFVNYDEVVKEVEAQYLAFIALVGRKPDYFEGHAVASETFFNALQSVAAKYECDYLPLRLNATTTFKHQPLAVFMDSMNPDYDPFETLQKCVKQTDDTIPSMLVLHPGYVDEYLLQHSSLTYARELEVNMILDPTVQQWLQNQNVNLISYRDIH